MAEQESKVGADSVRQEGNALYKAGKFIEAIDKYKEASKLAPDQSAPLANLAAACFEIGKYQESNDYATQALGSLDQAEAQNASAHRLRSRMVRAYMFLKQYSAARQTLASCSHPFEGQLLDISNQLENLNGEEDHAVSTDATTIPISQVYVSNQQPQIVGQDKPSSLFDTSLLSSNQDILSFLFAEVGDARNLFSTLVHIANPALGISSKLRYQITATDRNVAVIARDLLLLLLLDRAANNASSPELVAIYYIYIAPILPVAVHDIVHPQIEAAILMLEKRQPFPTYIEVAEEHRPQILAIFKLWLDTPSKINTASMRQAVVRAQSDAEHSEEIQFFPARLKKEAILYTKSGVLLADTQDAAKPGNLLDQFHNLSLRDTIDGAALDEIDQNWKPNVTLFDARHFKQNGSNDWPHLSFEPFEFGSKISAGEVSAQAGLFDVVGPWLRQVAAALHSLKHKTNIQLIPGEPTFVLLAENGTHEAQFDRIHLSDMPDTSGGAMYACLVGSALRPNQASYVTWKTTIHAQKLKDWRAYDAASFALPSEHTPQDVDALFQLRIDHATYAEDAGSSLFEKHALSGYRRARRSQHVSRSFDQLLPREKIESWLRRVLTRTNPLVAGQTKSKALVPYLNSNVLCLLLNRLNAVGYPAHWLNEAITGAFSAKTYSMSAPEELYKEHESSRERMMSIDAHQASIAWSHRLTFGIISPDVRNAVLQTYSLCFEELVLPAVPVVVALRFSKLSASPSDGEAVQEDTVTDLDEYPKDGRTLVMTVFQFAADSGLASFQLDKSLYRALRLQGYGVSVWSVAASSGISETVPLMHVQKGS